MQFDDENVTASKCSLYFLTPFNVVSLIRIQQSVFLRTKPLLFSGSGPVMIH
jgi:hypothetical protein